MSIVGQFIVCTLPEVRTLCQPFKSVVFFLAEELPQCIAPNVTILKITRELPM